MRGHRIVGKVEDRHPLLTVVLVAHVAPPVHGQAVMAAALVERAATWTRARLVVVNAAYARDRESLVTFSVRKVSMMLRYLVSALAAVRRTRAQFVIVTPAFYPGPFLKDAIMICVLRALTRARIIAWVHMDPARLDLEHKTWWYRQFARYAVGRVDSWVACAPILADQWPSFIPRDRRYVVTNGTPGVPKTVRAGDAASSAIRVCFISSLDSTKGWTDLLEAADEICRSHSDVEFHFYGDVGVGWTGEQVVRRFQACHFNQRILWHGVVRGDEKWSRLKSSDLFCLPSRTEQFPIVVLEAMASGLAIVATRVGAVEEAVLEGQGGWLVAPGSPEELTRALGDALEDRDRLERFGQFNAARQRQHFSIERFGSEWERFLAARAAYR